MKNWEPLIYGLVFTILATITAASFDTSLVVNTFAICGILSLIIFLMVVLVNFAENYTYKKSLRS